MKERVKALVLGAVALLGATSLHAQVGHDPAKSPYSDLEYRQEFTLLGGYLRARHDPADILPKSRPMFGVRYEATLTGPLAISSDVITGFGDRNVVNPNKPPATRNVGTQSNAVIEADVALAMNLTGTRSWHNLVPQVRAGLGLVRSAAKDDSSGYGFGTPFAFVFGGGVKYVRAGRWQLRTDLTERVFKQTYPDSYYRPVGDQPAVLPTSTAKSFYTHHAAFTLGVSYLFAR
jgi:hypothetical protein